MQASEIDFMLGGISSNTFFHSRHIRSSYDQVLWLISDFWTPLSENPDETWYFIAAEITL